MTPSPPSLRILATTDLHANALDWDHHRDEPRPGMGLSALAPLIDAARKDVPTLLVDNGDFLQGSPLGDWAAETQANPHPMIAAMNALAYDAATLGNHEFSHGLPLLDAALEQARFPVVSANIALQGCSRIPSGMILHRNVPDAAGTPRHLAIGVTGIAPPQTASWEARSTDRRLTAHDPLPAAQAAIADLRRQGADLVLLLAHTGIGEATYTAGMENAGHPLAALSGADVVILGHTHQTYPEGAATLPCPAVMPGCFGSHLGLIDLWLDHSATGWTVRRATPRLLRPDPQAPRHPAIARATRTAHDAARDWLNQPAGHSPAALRSHFARLRPCNTLRLIAAAQAQHARSTLTPDRIDGRPILAAAAPFRAGLRGAAAGCTDIATGPLLRRHLTDLYPHPNSLVTLAVTGQDVADWLERAATQFHAIAPDARDFPLIRPDIPAFDFDLIDGLTFGIDLSSPPRFDARGTLMDPAARRITRLAHQGQPVRPADRFLLVTNSYRADGAGGFPACTPDRIVADDGTPARAALAAFLAAGHPWQPARDDWQITPLPGATVLFDAPQGAERHLSDIARFRPEPLAADTDAADSPRRFRLHL